MSELKELTKIALKFRDDRDWKKHHTPKNSAISLMIEAAELLEHFQWHSGKKQDQYIAKHKGKISDELTEVKELLPKLV